MPVTPQQFATLLQQSSLNRSEKNALIGSLPRFSSGQIQKIAKILEEDAADQDIIFTEAKVKTASIQLKMKIGLEKL